MATHAHAPHFEMLHGCPTPPPTASSAYGPPQTLSQTTHTPPMYKRKPLHTPPAEITPVGQNQFRFTRTQPIEHSSRRSSISGHAYAGTTPQETEYESTSSESSEEADERPRRPVEEASFVIEEVDTDDPTDSDIEILQPSHCEDAKSERSTAIELEDTTLTHSLGALHVSSDESTAARSRIYSRRKKRWSRGLGSKRDHAESIAGESSCSYADADPHDDPNIESRRLRRKLSQSGPWDRDGLWDTTRRCSLNFEDKGFPNTNNIIEEEEPDDSREEGGYTRGPPSIPSDDAFTLDELPFWGGEWEMAVDGESGSEDESDEEVV